MKIDQERKKINKALVVRQSIIEQIKAEKVFLKNQIKIFDSQQQAQEIAQNVAMLIQQRAHKKIEGVVNKCLEAIFNKLYQFKIEFERKRGRTEAKLILLKDGHEIRDVLDADSGGVIDVAALALRLSCIVLAKPTLKRIIIMDEPFRNLDATNREHMRILLEELSNDFKVQFIIVTHENAFKIGKVIQL